MSSNPENPKKPIKYCCEKCDFLSFNKKDYLRHINTKKHLFDKNQCFSMEKTPKNPNFMCMCGKKYKDNSGLWRHKKKCLNKKEDSLVVIKETKETKEVKEDQLVNVINKDELIKYLMKENGEFKEMLLEQNKLVMKVCDNKGGSINNSNINSNNKTFNLNVFLNEECKDAMNIMEFVDSLKLQLSDLENVGKLGFVDGISNIIVKNLKAMDIHKRPVHCSDTKRDVMYVKDEDKWEKDNDESKKLRKAIKHIAHKNSKLLPEFKSKYPDCIYSDSKKSDQYNKIIIEAMGGHGDNDNEKEDKIIKNIAKEVIIDKTSEC